eukprot:gene1626-12751_t
MCSNQQNKVVPLEIRRHCAILFDHAMYIFGGILDTGEYVNIMYKYNFGTEKWKIINQINPPQPRCAHTCTLYKDEMYCFGGSKGIQKLSDFHKFSFSNYEWKEIKDCRGNRPGRTAYHSSNLYKNKLLIFGGFDGTTMDIKDLYEYNFEMNEWKMIETTGLPFYFQCASHSSVIWRNEMYTFGFNSNEIYCLNLETYKWRLIDICGTITPTDRVCHSFIKQYDSMYISGGIYSEESFPDLYEFNFKLKNWNLISNELPKRNKHSSVLYKNTIYFFGGTNFDPINSTNSNSNLLWKFELTKNITKNILENKNYEDLIFKFSSDFE